MGTIALKDPGNFFVGNLHHFPSGTTSIASVIISCPIIAEAVGP
jgi:hypothetical protein